MVKHLLHNVVIMATTSLPSASLEPSVSQMSSFIYASEYDFLPLGVKKVKQDFGKSLAKENLVSVLLELAVAYRGQSWDSHEA